VTLTGHGTSDAIVSRLAVDLDRAESGVGFVYDALSTLVTLYGLGEAVLVIDDPVIGRQAFRAGRHPLIPGGGGQESRAGRMAGSVLSTAAGLHCEPEVVDREVAASVTALCRVAVQLDVRRHDASHDPLTGLYNRRSFDVGLERSASRSLRYGWPFALALLDVDRFKALNDRLGHHGGDQVLRVVGHELRRSLRAGDTAARVGGDEFGLILSNDRLEQVAPLLERLEHAVQAAVGVELGFSAGVATAPGDGTDAVELYRLADRRLYEAKVRVG